METLRKSWPVVLSAVALIAVGAEARIRLADVRSSVEQQAARLAAHETAIASLEARRDADERRAGETTAALDRMQAMLEKLSINTDRVCQKVGASCRD